MYCLIIDGDNIASKYAESLFELINAQKYSKNILIRRLYGDFTKLQNKAWCNNAIKYNLDTRQIWTTNYDKNSTDIAIITDICFDIELQNPNLIGFIIVTGDGDFRFLIDKLKKRGKHVIGISTNENSTSEALINICDQFHYLHQTKKVSSDEKSIMIGTNLQQKIGINKIKQLILSFLKKKMIS